MSTTTKKDQELFEVTIVEKIEKLHAGSGVALPIKIKKHLMREGFVAESAKSAENMAIRKLTAKMTDANAEAFIDSLKVKVEIVNFRD